MASKGTRRISKNPSPMSINDDLWAAWKSCTMMAAIQLDVFTSIAQGRRTAAEIASAAGANTDAMRRLLDCVVALKHLRRKGEAYALEPHAATYLVRGSEFYLENSVPMNMALINDWMGLAESVRSGRPVARGGDSDRMMEFMPILVK